MPSPFTEQLTQGLAVVGALFPASNHAGNSAADYSISGIDMSRLRRLITYLNCGTYGASANVQLYYVASANANMAGNTNVAASIPLTASTNNRIESLEVRKDQLPSGTRYCAPVIIVNTAAVQVDAIVLGGAADYSPASQFNTTNILDQGIVT